MKELKNELKKIIAVKLLDFAFILLPEGEFKKQYSKFILENIMKL
jgi:hypothetical protein